MKFNVSGSHKADAKSQKIDEQNMTIETEPLLVRGQHVMRVGYVKATGDAGNESSAVVLFNANTGEFSIKNTTPSDTPTFDFDLPVDEFKQKRAKSKKTPTNNKPPVVTPPTPPNS